MESKINLIKLPKGDVVGEDILLMKLCVKPQSEAATVLNENVSFSHADESQIKLISIRRHFPLEDSCSSWSADQVF